MNYENSLYNLPATKITHACIPIHELIDSAWIYRRKVWLNIPLWNSLLMFSENDAIISTSTQKNTFCPNKVVMVNRVALFSLRCFSWQVVSSMRSFLYFADFYTLSEVRQNIWYFDLGFLVTRTLCLKKIDQDISNTLIYKKNKE